MTRPQHIPEGASFDENDGTWRLGETNADGQKTGLWTTWHKQGYRWITVAYGDGTPPFHVQRFHPDGTLGEEADWYGGAKFLGISRHIKSDHPTNEPFPTGGGDKAKNVWMAEFDYIDEGIYNTQRYYDRKNNPVSSDGEPVPERPANVPPRAHFVTNPHAPTAWVMGQVDCRIGTYVGEYFEWDLNGVPVLTRVYDAAGTAQEEYTYKNGLLTNSQVNTDIDITTTKYYKALDPVVMENQTIYRNNRADRTYIYYNQQGQQTYSVRKETISDLHGRRYFNDKLVCEGINTGEIEDAVMDAKYYLEDGTLFISFTSLGEGTGVWTRHDTAGKIHVTNHDDDYKLKRFDVFMPKVNKYESDTTQTDWEAVKENFDIHAQRQLALEKLHSLPVPPPLQSELDKVNWAEVETCFYGGKDLPIAINGLLSEDEAIVKISNGKIWMQIEHQESVYEATYVVTGILARMLPHYTHLPAVQLRLLDFLYDVFTLYYINDLEEHYKELITSIDAALPILSQWADDADTNIALKAKYILVHAGNTTTEKSLMAEWQNTTYSNQKRGIALYALCYFYLLRKQKKKLITLLTTSFDSETNVMLRFIMASYLVLLNKKKAHETWLAQVLYIFTHDTGISEDFACMEQYTREEDLQDYILQVLGAAAPAALEPHIESVIDALPDAGILQKLTYFSIIFQVLFKKRAALKELTPLRKKALLVAADEITKDPGFVNRIEIFDEYHIPHDADKLRKLAK